MDDLPRGRSFEQLFFGHNGTQFPLDVEYVSFRQAVNQVWWRASEKRGFFYSRYTKNTPLMDQFIRDIEKELFVTDEKFISICSGIGTPLDLRHRIDALITFCGKCTYVDLTLMPGESSDEHIIKLHRDSFESLYGRKKSAYNIAQKLIV